MIVRGEIFNSATHLAGSVFAVAGLVALVSTSVRSGDPRRIASFAVYGVSLVALYLFSTLYHGLSGPAKRIFRKLDHTSIYVLIAGTYSPFALVSLRRSGGAGLLVLVWLLAAAGIAQEFMLAKRLRALSVSLYLFMGWLAAGGLLYSAGVFFYLVDERYAHSHGVFHLFVLGGSILHFIVVLFFVA
jgi:hemolysin III